MIGRRLRWGLPVIWLFLAGSLLQAEAVPRVALSEFATDENTWDALAEAQNLSAVVQTQLSSESGFEWVERSQLQTIRRELELAASFGSPDSAQSLRLARWAKADLLVTGHFSEKGATRELHLEVIDVAHADVLASLQVKDLPEEKSLTGALLQQSGRISDATREVLQEAKKRVKEVAGLPCVAVLFYPSLPLFNEDFLSALEDPKRLGRKVRVLRFPRAAAAEGEISLAMAGLTEDPEESWRSVADIYIWGTLARREAGSIDGEVIMDAHTPDVEITVWDGRGMPVTLAEKGDSVERRDFPAAIAKQADRFVQNIGRLFDLPPSAKAEPDQRQKISRILLENAAILEQQKLYDEQYVSAPTGRLHFFNLVQTLAAACFFDPANKDAQELLACFRWERSLENDVKNRFRFHLGRSEAWGQFIERFGFPVEASVSADPFARIMRGDPDRLPEILLKKREASLAREYLDSACEAMDVAKLGNKEDYGFPPGVPAEAEAEWKETLTKEIAKRTIVSAGMPGAPTEEGLRAVFANYQGFYLRDAAARLDVLERIWPKISPSVKAGLAADRDLRAAIKKTFAEAHRASDEAPFFTGLTTAVATPLEPSGQALSSASPPDLNLTPLPGTNRTLLPDQNTTSAPTPSLADLARAPVVLTPSIESMDIEATGVFSISSLAVLAGRGWFIGRGLEVSSPQSVDPSVSQPLQPAKHEAYRLFGYNPATGTASLAAGVESFTPVDLLPNADRLWMTFGKDGVGQYDPAAGSLRFFGPGEGLQSGPAYWLAKADNRIFVTSNFTVSHANLNDPSRWEGTGGDDDFPVHFEGAHLGGIARRFSGYGTHLFLYEGYFSVTDIPGKRRFVNNEKSPFDNVVCTAANPDGFWIGATAGLFQISLSSASVAARFEPDHPVRGPVTALAVDGDFLWVASCRGKFHTPSDIFVLHTPSRRWVAQFVANQTIAMTVDEKYVWLGNSLSYGDGKKCLQRVEKQAIYSVPESQWIPAATSP